MGSYISYVKDRLSKMTKRKAISYLRGALMVMQGNPKNTEALKKLLEEVMMWEE